MHLSKRRANSFINLPIMVKKCLLICCTAAIFAAFILVGCNTVEADSSVTAEIAMELSTGSVLEESNADIRMPMASTTKIMTALIVIEENDLNDELIVDDAAVGVEGSSIYLKYGEKIDVRDLVYGLMMRSGNDSAVALAIYNSGSVEDFVEKMNSKARELGALDTNFSNPNGLPDDNHYTTARDLCKIACYAMKNETFSEVVSTKNYNGKFRSYTNKNKMLFNYDGANGVKTGYTVKAGRCLVASAKRGDMDIVSVVLNCPDMYERTTDILDSCFKAYKLIEIDENDVFMSDKVLCKPSKSIRFVSKTSENVNFKVSTYKDLKNIRRGDLVAKLEIYGQNGLILSENLYSIIDR